MPSAFSRSISGLIRHAPSSRLYSVCRCRWANIFDSFLFREQGQGNREQGWPTAALSGISVSLLPVPCFLGYLSVVAFLTMALISALSSSAVRPERICSDSS